MHYVALAVFLAAPVLITAQDKIGGRASSGSPALGTYEDRIAVEDVMARYVWAVDSLDADGYVAVFTEDATRSEDRLVKRNGKWLIQSRILTVFTD